nr:PREDICTED: uncharacterized protein LOC105664395 [Megachile rotundata]
MYIRKRNGSQALAVRVRCREGRRNGKREAGSDESLKKQEAVRWTALECKLRIGRDTNKRRVSEKERIERVHRGVKDLRGNAVKPYKDRDQNETVTSSRYCFNLEYVSERGTVIAFFDSRRVVTHSRS